MFWSRGNQEGAAVGGEGKMEGGRVFFWKTVLAAKTHPLFPDSLQSVMSKELRPREKQKDQYRSLIKLNV